MPTLYEPTSLTPDSLPPLSRSLHLTMGLLTRGVQLLQADLCFPLTHTLRFYRSSSRLKGLVTPALSQIHIFSERTKRSPSHVVSKLLPCFHPASNPSTCSCWLPAGQTSAICPLPTPFGFKHNRTARSHFISPAFNYFDVWPGIQPGPP